MNSIVCETDWLRDVIKGVIAFRKCPPTATVMAKKFSAMTRMEILAFQIIKKPQGIHAKFVMV
jgi:hypothetical protein